MDPVKSRIRSASLNRDLTHSTFRLYTVLVIALDGQVRTEGVDLSVPKLRDLIPGVKGKPLSSSALRQSLQELVAAGLIEIDGPQWSKFSLRVRLSKPVADWTSPSRISSLVLQPPSR